MEGEGVSCYGGSVLSVDHKVEEGVLVFCFEFAVCTSRESRTGLELGC